MVSIEIDKKFYEITQEEGKPNFPDKIPFDEFEIKVPILALVDKKQIINSLKAQYNISSVDPIMLMRRIETFKGDNATLKFFHDKDNYHIELYDGDNYLWYKFSYEKDFYMQMVPKVEYSLDMSIESSNQAVGLDLKDLVIGTIEYMNKPAVKKTKTNKKVKEKVKSKKENLKSKRKKVVNIRKTVYEIKNDTLKDNSKNNYERHTDSWYVRGHYRRYRDSNGKVKKKVWVPGYWKGEEKSKIDKKYKINN